MDFLQTKHVKYFLRNLECLPAPYSSTDTSRMTLLFFSLSGLDILNALDKIEDNRDSIIDWIYSLQLLPKAGDEDVGNCGFLGSTYLGNTFNKDGSFTASDLYNNSHITMTYTALCSLIILDDDLSRVNKQAVINGLKSLQNMEGSFIFTKDGSENDMRFLYCACCISYILQDWSGINRHNAVTFIRSSMCFDYGISQEPHLESHGGSTFCGLASLLLMGKLNECFDGKQLYYLSRWCLKRQKDGFQGRPNKPVDTCYSFWIGGSLQILDSFKYICVESNKDFLLQTQDPVVGGFGKWPDSNPDAMHSFLGLGGMSLMNLYGLQPLFPALNITERAYAHLRKLHRET